jgi:predicted lipoprotein with Yx(FWY)xxD motif
MSTTRSALPTLTWLAGGAFLVGALAACGDAADPAPAAEAAVAPPAAEAPAAPAPAAPEPETVARLSTGVGVVATTDEGLTLYRFDEDSNDPATTACLDACTQRWIPLTVDGSALPGAGVDGALLGTLQRPDGTTQATLEGWPLYTFVGDTAPGQTNGEGVGGTWHAIAPDGRPAAVASAPAEPAPAEPYSSSYAS